MSDRGDLIRKDGAHDPGDSALAAVGALANRAAAPGVFADYLDRKAPNTLRRHAADLDLFARFLDLAAEDIARYLDGADAAPLAAAVRQIGPRMAAYAAAVRALGEGVRPDLDPGAWAGLTWGLVAGFVRWQMDQSYAVRSVNARLSTVKAHAERAMLAGVIERGEYAAIRSVKGYAEKEFRHVDSRRKSARRGRKKAASVPLDDEQAERLKSQPDTPQGRRDALLMCLLLDHGLRAGEVAALQVAAVQLSTGRLSFFRPKVGMKQTHKLSPDTLRAAQAWFESGDAPESGPLLRASAKASGGARRLTTPGLTERAINKRVAALGKLIGVEGLSPHDCRHYWATRWAHRVDGFRLKEAGGWRSMETVSRYVEASKIANEGMF